MTFAATAPAAPAVLEAELVKEAQFWFNDWGSLSVASTPALWSALRPVAGPALLGAGQSQTFAVPVTNTGNQAWPAGGTMPVHIGATSRRHREGGPTRSRPGSPHG